MLNHLEEILEEPTVTLTSIRPILNAIHRDERRKSEFDSQHNPEGIERKGTLMRSKQHHYRVFRPQKKKRDRVLIHYEPIRQRLVRQRSELVFKQAVANIMGSYSLLQIGPFDFSERTAKDRREALTALDRLQKITRKEIGHYASLSGCNNLNEILYPPTQSSICITDVSKTQSMKVISALEYATEKILPKQEDVQTAIDRIALNYANKMNLRLETSIENTMGLVEEKVNAIHTKIHKKIISEEGGEESSYWIKRNTQFEFNERKNEYELYRATLYDQESNEVSRISLFYRTRLNVDFKNIFQIYEIRAENIPDKFLLSIFSDKNQNLQETNTKSSKKYRKKPQYNNKPHITTVTQ